MAKRLPPSADRLPVPLEVIERRIYLVRGQEVMLDSDLAELYQVETRALIQAVKRNADRFPEDLMFQLTLEEADSLRSQIVISKAGRGGRRYLPYAFTEHGVAMLSSVLNSARAVQMNIIIIRAFVRLREILATHRDLAQQIEQLKVTQQEQGSIIALVAKDVQTLARHVAKELRKLKVPRRHKPCMGFHIPDDNQPDTGALFHFQPVFPRCPASE